jgi:DHA2 family methylenomycin A resistance protein-like MFS transporter
MVSGFGIGMVIPVMTSAVMGSAPAAKAGQASGVLSTMRQVGSVLGIAVMGAVLQNRAVLYLEQAVTAGLALGAASLIACAALALRGRRRPPTGAVSSVG